MEDSSTNPDRVEQQTTAVPPAMEGTQDVPPNDAMYNQDVSSHFTHGNLQGDGSEAGHEVAPPRATPDPNDVGYYARQHAHEDDLADNVASDVRHVPSAHQREHSNGSVCGGDGTPQYEDITVQQVQQQGQEAGNEDGATGERLHSADASGAPPRHPSVADTTQPTTVSRQPCHGTQVNAEVDMPAEGDHHDSVTERTTIDAAAVASPTSIMAMPSDNADSAAASVFAPQQWRLLPQAAEGMAEVTATLLPMQALTRITVPVHNPNLYGPLLTANAHIGYGDETERHDGGDAALCSTQERGPNVSPYWVLVAKELFEALATHLSLHPESFHIYHQHKRLRFMGTLFVDCNVTSIDPTAAAGATPMENNRAEPVWVSVVFPNPDDTLGAAAAMDAAGQHPQHPFTSTSYGEDGNAGESHASLAGVPAHLAGLSPDDYITRCIRVRRRKAEIPPHTLVEGRRQGFSYDEVIQQMQNLHDAAVQGDVSSSGKGGTAASNFATIAVVQDSPTPPTKPFLGGYRDKRQPHHILLHATTQLYHRDLEYSPFAKSGVAIAAAGGTDRVSRKTQTFGISRSCQTHREACAQTPRVDLLLDTSHDFVVVARPYFTSEALQALQDEMAVVIQKLYRQWKARQICKELEAAESARQHRAGARQRREEALNAAVEDAAQLRRDDPRSAMDFERVRQDIIAWRAEEAACIQSDATLSAADKHVALLAITKKELQLLQQLDQRRREVGKTREEMAFLHNLNRIAAPKQWGTVHVVTPETERAGELRDLYERLIQTSGPGRGGGTVGASSMRMETSTKADAPPRATSPPASSFPGYAPQGSKTAGASQSGKSAATLNTSGTPAFAETTAEGGLTSMMAARLDILLRVKWTVREFSATSALARELGELIDREADLLHRGRKDVSLSGLRKRIQALFAQFIEDPEYNPGVKNFVQTARGRARVRAVESEKPSQPAKVQKGRI